MAKIGSVFSPAGVKALLLGSGELGKEVAIELQRMGVEVIACDRYQHAPAMQVAHRGHTLNMLDGDALRTVSEAERPDHIIPEVEAIATDELVKLEQEGFNVTPTARAARLTMNREGIRRLAAEELGPPTSPYRFADTREEFDRAIAEIGLPCVVKPVMSSSGHGQTTVRRPEQIDAAWHEAQEGGRAGAGRVIVEGFVDFDYEITLLTVRSVSGTVFCEPVGHVQVEGDYRESWQPQPMSGAAVEKAREIARAVTDALGPSASRAIVVEGDTDTVEFDNLEKALAEEGVQIRIFGKPEIKGHRRMGVLLAWADTVEEARAKTARAYEAMKINVLPRRH